MRVLGVPHRLLWLLTALAWLLAVVPSRVECQIRNISLSTADAALHRGLLLANLADGSYGHVCLLNELNVGQSACAVLLGRPKDVMASANIFDGSPATNVVAAIDGCPHFKEDQSTKWDLNNDCNIITGPSIPSACASRPLEVQCSFVELRHGPSANEGLAVVKRGGSFGSICASGVGMTEAESICRSLGSTSPGRAIPLIGRYGNDGYENATVEGFRCGAGAAVESCSWRPVTLPECLLASNRLGVSCPDDPVTPKPRPSPQLLCYRQQAHVCFHAASLNSTADLEVANSANASLCRSSVTYFSNGTHICLLVTDYDACSVTSSDLGNLMEHHLRVLFKGERDPNGNYVRPPLTFNFFCQVAKETLATGASLAPDFETPTTARDGHIGGDAVIELYRDLANGGLSGELVGSVEVGSIVYAAVILKNALPNSWLVVNDCWAQEGSSRADLVVKKCPSTRGVTVIPVNSTVVAVRFQAFLFNGSSGSSAKINLICSTVTCRQGDPSRQCSRACGTFDVSGRFAEAAAIVESTDGLLDRQDTPPVQLTVLQGGTAKAASPLGPAAAVVAPLTPAVLATFLLAAPWS